MKRLLALASLLLVTATLAEAQQTLPGGYWEFHQNPPPESIYANGCDGWQNLYVPVGNTWGWPEGFWQWAPGAWLYGPRHMFRAGTTQYNVWTPWCSWALARTVFVRDGWWLLTLADEPGYGPGWFMHYHADSGFTSEPLFVPAGGFITTPFRETLDPGEQITGWGTGVGDRITTRADGAEVLYDINSGQGLVLAAAGPPPVPIPVNPNRQTIETWAIQSATASEDLADKMFTQIQAANAAAAAGRRDLLLTIEVENIRATYELIRDRAFAIGILKQDDRFRGTIMEQAHARSQRARDNFQRLMADLYTILTTRQPQKVEWYTPYRPAPSIPPVLPPVPPVPSLPPPPLPPPPTLTPQQRTDLETVANYIEYGHSKGWNDAQICYAICPIIKGSNLGPILQDAAYTGVISDTLRGFSPGIIPATDYGAVVQTLNDLGARALPPLYDQGGVLDPGFKLIQTIN